MTVSGAYYQSQLQYENGQDDFQDHMKDAVFSDHHHYPAMSRNNLHQIDYTCSQGSHGMFNKSAGEEYNVGYDSLSQKTDRMYKDTGLLARADTLSAQSPAS